MTYKKPDAGISIDESFIIQTLETSQSACVEIDIGSFVIYISRFDLEAMAHDSVSEWNTEEERMRLISKQRAQMLLESCENSSGKLSVQFDSYQIGAEYEHLILHMIESQKAAIFDKESNEFITRVSIRYYGNRIDRLAGFGHIIVSTVKRSDQILFIDWWRA